MDVLKRLFEQHYQLPAEHVQPLQGQLGGSGRAILRLTGEGISAAKTKAAKASTADMKVGKTFPRWEDPERNLIA